MPRSRARKSRSIAFDGSTRMKRIAWEAMANRESTKIFAWIFAPLAYVMGVPWADASQVGSLFGKKLLVNEFVAYADLINMKAADVLAPRYELHEPYAI